MTDSGRAWISGIALAAAVWLVGWIVTRILLHRLRAWARRTSVGFDDLLLHSLGPQLQIWFLALGLAAGARLAPLDDDVVRIVDHVVRTVIAVSAALAAATFVIGLLRARNEPGDRAAPVNTLVQAIVYALFLALAGLTALAGLGISITPLLTALGVGSLALALALQPTLSNLFAGVHLVLGRNVRVGDVIELENGQQGVVVDIGWRSTLLREFPDNTIIVPNARMVEMVLRSFGLPDSEHNLSVPFGVAYGSDLDRVRVVAAEVAGETQRALGVTATPFAPVVLVRAFGGSAVELTAVLRVPHFVDRNPMTDDFLRRLHRRFRAEGIEIPLPQLVVHRRPSNSAQVETIHRDP
jgi:small-conductance mechanosensitive channel